LILLAVTLFSCGDDVRFEVPQPEGRGDEEAFPKKIRGTYRNSKDSSLVTITADQITRKFDTRFALHKSNLDSSFKIKGDTSFYDSVEKMNITVKGDSVYGRLKYADTLFSISLGNKLRIFKGYYFLNRQKSFNNWEVQLMTFKGKELTILYDWNENDLIKMRQITHTNDSARTFKPTRGQLKKIIQEKGFKDGDKYDKISK
jgi:hypothetical protein